MLKKTKVKKSKIKTKVVKKSKPVRKTSKKAPVKKIVKKKPSKKIIIAKKTVKVASQRTREWMDNIEKDLRESVRVALEDPRIKESKFDIGVVHNSHALNPQEPPLEYGKDKAVLLVVDPRFAFTYWEIKAETIIKAAQQLGGDAKLTLRFFDITHTHTLDGSPSWDVEAFDRLGNWYLKLEHPEQLLCVVVGMKNSTGNFFAISTSNIVKLPAQTLAKPGHIKWMAVTPSGEKLVSNIEEYTDADLELLKKILGPYFYDLLMRGRFASIAGSSVEGVFYDVGALRLGESPSGKPAWLNT